MRIVLLAFMALAAHAQTVETFIGNGTTEGAQLSNIGLVCSNVRGTSVNPSGVAVDQAGNVLVSTPSLSRVSSTGVLLAGQSVLGTFFTVLHANPFGVAVGTDRGSCAAVASNNVVGVFGGVPHLGSFAVGNCFQSGDSGDGGSTANARFGKITAVAVNRIGNVYLYDESSRKIRAIDRTLKVSTFLSNVNLDSNFINSSQNALSADSRGLVGLANGSLVRISSSGLTPFGPADFDSGSPYTFDLDDNLYYFSTEGALIRRTPSGTSMVLGLNNRTGSFRENMPAAEFGSGLYPGMLAADTAGNIYLAENIQGRDVSANSTDFRLFRLKVPSIARPNCVFSVNPLARPFDVQAETFTATVTASNPNCYWSFSSPVPWASFSGEAVRQGSGQIRIAVTFNSGAFRFATLNIAGLNFVMTQTGNNGTTTPVVPVPSPPPVITGISHATNGSRSVSSGVFMSMYGSNLASSTLTWDQAIVNGKLPTDMGGVRVLVQNSSLPDGSRPAAFLYFVSPTQINVLLPESVYANNFEVTVVRGSSRTTSFVGGVSVAPGWFTYPAAGRTYIAGYLANSTDLIAPENAIAGASTKPAAPGDAVVLYLTGCGNSLPKWPIGEVLTRDYPSVFKAAITIAGLPAVSLYEGMVFAGVCQVNTLIPQGTPPGPQPVVLTFSGAEKTQAAAVIEIRNP